MPMDASANLRRSFLRGGTGLCLALESMAKRFCLFIGVKADGILIPDRSMESYHDTFEEFLCGSYLARSFHRIVIAGNLEKYSCAFPNKSATSPK
jgi:hypothetical protein